MAGRPGHDLGPRTPRKGITISNAANGLAIAPAGEATKTLFSFADFMRTRIFGQQVPESSVNSAKFVFLALLADF